MNIIFKRLMLAISLTSGVLSLSTNTAVCSFSSHITTTTPHTVLPQKANWLRSLQFCRTNLRPDILVRNHPIITLCVGLGICGVIYTCYSGLLSRKLGKIVGVKNTPLPFYQERFNTMKRWLLLVASTLGFTSQETLSTEKKPVEKIEVKKEEKKKTDQNLIDTSIALNNIATSTQVKEVKEKIVTTPTLEEQKTLAKTFLLKSETIQETFAEDYRQFSKTTMPENLSKNDIDQLPADALSALIDAVAEQTEVYLEDKENVFSNDDLLSIFKRNFNGIVMADTDEQIIKLLEPLSLNAGLALIDAANYFALSDNILLLLQQHFFQKKFFSEIIDTITNNTIFWQNYGGGFLQLIKNTNSFSKLIIKASKEGKAQYTSGPLVAFSSDDTHYAVEDVKTNKINEFEMGKNEAILEIENKNGPAKNIFFKLDKPIINEFIVIENSKELVVFNTSKNKIQAIIVPPENLSFKQIVSIPKHGLIFFLYNNNALDLGSVYFLEAINHIEIPESSILSIGDITVSQQLLSFFAGLKDGSSKEINIKPVFSIINEQAGRIDIRIGTENLSDEHSESIPNIIAPLYKEEEYGKEILVTSLDTKTLMVKLTNIGTSSKIKLSLDSNVADVLFNPSNSSELLTTTENGFVTLWDFSNTEKTLQRFELQLPQKKQPRAIQFIKKNIIIIAPQGSADVLVIDAQTGKTMHMLTMQGPVSSIAFNEPKKLLLVSSSKGDVRLYDIGNMLVKYDDFVKNLRNAIKEKNIIPEQDSPLEGLLNLAPASLILPDVPS